MTNRPDIRGNMDKNDDLLHKIMGIIPGYKGYADREQRRDADKMLRMYIAGQYNDQHKDLLRTQQKLARAHQLDSIGELDRLGGVLQRLIDKIQVATYGYTGMFDPIKVEAAELDQIYAFDEAMLDGVDKVKAALSSVDAAAKPGAETDMETALSGLADVLDTLGDTWTHRQDLLISGQPMDQADFDRFRATQAAAPAAPMQQTGDAGATGGYVAPNYSAPSAPGYNPGAPTAPMPPSNVPPSGAPQEGGQPTQRFGPDFTGGDSGNN